MYDKFDDQVGKPEKKVKPKARLIDFSSTESIFDKERADCLAQYATAKETPSKKWDNTTTKLSELDTSRLHYVKVPENHIVIDFDIPDEHGKKCFEKNLEEASKWPATYAELSKSGAGIHLHYIYSGDVDQLAPLYYVRGDAAPMLVISGDREIELFGRYEENAYFVRMLRLNGHQNVTFYELDGFDHGDMAEPAHLLLLKYIRKDK